MTRNFMELVRARWGEDKFVCVGLDTDPRRLPSGRTIYDHNWHLVEATGDLACAFKLNVGFYLMRGPGGLEALRDTCDFIRKHAPGVPIILDGKWGDIGSSSDAYQDAAFDALRGDAATVNPYLGQDGLQPFLDQTNQGIVVLCRTSNQGAAEFQDRIVTPHPEEWMRWTDDESERKEFERYIGEGDLDLEVPEMPFYQLVAYRVTREWNEHGNCALVLGATHPDELRKVREIAPKVPFLLPGVGVQGADVKTVIQAGVDADGTGIIVNASRSIIFASDGDDFPAAARQKTIELSDEINQYREVPA